MQIQSYSRSNEASASTYDVGQTSLISGTYAEIKELRDTSRLIAGCNYKITDYVAVIDDNSIIRSANHPFDLILFAESQKIFSEQARAIQHEPLDSTQEEIGKKDYFANNKLEAWKVYYCLDNDQTRFTWASQNGKGVIYRLIDEFNNDAPYDFKSIQFLPHVNESDVGLKFRYTFDSNDTQYNYDLSINSVRPVYANTIAAVYDNGVQKLNRIILKGFCINNTINAGCSDIVITNSCSNIIKKDSQHIVFNESCHNNIIGRYCKDINLGSDCHANIIRNHCEQITLADSATSNIIGDNCSNIVFNKPRYRYLTIEDCNKNINLECTAETYDTDDWYQNVIVSRLADKTIVDPRKNQTYITTFANRTDRVVSL